MKNSSISKEGERLTHARAACVCLKFCSPCADSIAAKLSRGKFSISQPAKLRQKRQIDKGKS